MPKEITHIIFSNKVLEQTIKDFKHNKLTELLQRNSVFFHFGSIATDTFYYNLKIPFIDKDFFQWGDLVHGAEGNDTSLLWWEMLELLKKDPFDPLFEEKLAFLCGFVTHCAMDITFHPYVYYFSGNYFDTDPQAKVNAEMRHRIIESWLDLHVLEKTGLTPESFSEMNRIFSDQKTNHALLGFLCKAAGKAWNTEKDLFSFIKRGYIVQRYLNLHVMKSHVLREFCRLANDIFDHKLRAYLALFYPSGKFPDKIVNFDFFLHPVTGEKISGNTDALFSQGSALGATYLNAIKEFIFDGKDREQLENTLVGYSLDVGLLGVKVQDVVYFSPMEIYP